MVDMRTMEDKSPKQCIVFKTIQVKNNMKYNLKLNYSILNDIGKCLVKMGLFYHKVTELHRFHIEERQFLPFLLDLNSTESRSFPLLCITVILHQMYIGSM